MKWFFFIQRLKIIFNAFINRYAKPFFDRYLEPFFDRYIMTLTLFIANNLYSFLKDIGFYDKMMDFFEWLEDNCGKEFKWGFKLVVQILVIWCIVSWLSQLYSNGFNSYYKIFFVDSAISSWYSWKASITLFTAKIMWLVIGLINKLYTVLIPSAIIYFGVAIMLFKNPIYSLLALISVFFNVIFILLSLNIEFLAMIFLIIYIGAVSILFLFVIMLFNLRNIKYNATWMKRVGFYTGLLSLGLFVKFFFVVKKAIASSLTNTLQFFDFAPHNVMDWYFRITQSQDIMILGNLFYTHFFELFVTIGYILLIAMVGAIILAMGANEMNQKHAVIL